LPILNDLESSDVSILASGISTAARQDQQTVLLSGIDNSLNNIEFVTTIVDHGPTTNAQRVAAELGVNGSAVTASNPVPITGTVSGINIDTRDLNYQTDSVTVVQSGVFSVLDTPVGTATVTDIPASPTTVILAPANSSRISITIFNDSNKALTIKLGSGASATDRTTQLPPKSEYNMLVRYTGIITGFWAASASGSAAVTEFLI
jgi:hypothetical protein